MEKTSAFIKAFPITWIVTFIIGMLLYFFTTELKAISFALGSVTTLMMMSMLFKTTNKILMNETDKVQAQRMTARNYAIRYGFYILILVISALHPKIEVLFVAFGLFVFRFVLYAILFISMRGEQK